MHGLAKAALVRIDAQAVKVQGINRGQILLHQV
jgi:hypothetical protein